MLQLSQSSVKKVQGQDGIPKYQSNTKIVKVYLSGGLSIIREVPSVKSEESLTGDVVLDCFL